MTDKHCSKCSLPRRASGRYCLVHHAAYIRKWRETHPLTGEAKMKHNARCYANCYVRRGKIARKPCRTCGNKRSQMRHNDYSKPLEVVWLCRPCHLKHHATTDAK
jgi:hypothetical protein